MRRRCLSQRREKVLEPLEEELGVAFVDGHLQEDPHSVELQPLGIAQFAVDDAGVVVHPELHVVAGIGRARNWRRASLRNPRPRPRLPLPRPRSLPNIA